MNGCALWVQFQLRFGSEGGNVEPSSSVISTNSYVFRTCIIVSKVLRIAEFDSDNDPGEQNIFPCLFKIHMLRISSIRFTKTQVERVISRSARADATKVSEKEGILKRPISCRSDRTRPVDTPLSVREVPQKVCSTRMCTARNDACKSLRGCRCQRHW